MVSAARPAFQAIVDQALRVTGASTGWLLVLAGPSLQVVATAGLARQRDVVGTGLTTTGARGYVLSSGQPVALMPQPHDQANHGAAGYPGVPPSVLAVPCGLETAVGVLEVAGKHEAQPFTFDDIEVAAALGAVAGAALSEGNPVATRVVSPIELAAQLEDLALADPVRYADTARLIDSLLSRRS
jgi:GAF domain-containing protein